MTVASTPSALRDSEQSAAQPVKQGASRRGFLTGVAASVGVVSLAQLVQAAVATADQSKPRYGMLVDTAQCVSGCSACVDACKDEHGLHGFDAPLTDAQWIRKLELRHKQTGKHVSMPLMCQHCEHPPCVDVCPTGASFKRSDGLVLVDKHICIGCRYCVMACPYKARSFVHENLTDQLPATPRGKGTVEGCTLCVHRIDGDGQQPTACAAACGAAGHNAILFGDLHDPQSEIATRLRKQSSVELRADLRLNTGVRYQNI
jgi:tetrathionate reductase subunit B